MTTKTKDTLQADPTSAAIRTLAAGVQADAAARIEAAAHAPLPEQAAAEAAVMQLEALRGAYGLTLTARLKDVQAITVDLGAAGRHCAARVEQLIGWIRQGFEHVDHVALHVGRLEALSLEEAEPEMFRPSVVASARQAFRWAAEAPGGIEGYWAELEERWKELGEYVRRATPVAAASRAVDSLEPGPGSRPRHAQSALSGANDD